MTEQPSLFPDLQPQPPPAKLSTGAARTARQHAAIVAGHHPLAPSGLDPDPGHTCGSCRHRDHSERGYPKCHGWGPQLLTHSAATDVRAKWPGCTRWQARG